MNVNNFEMLIRLQRAMQEDMDRILPNVSVQFTIHPMIPGYPANWFKERFLEPAIKIGAVQQMASPVSSYLNQVREPLLSTELLIRELQQTGQTAAHTPREFTQTETIRPSPQPTPGPRKTGRPTYPNGDGQIPPAGLASTSTDLRYPVTVQGTEESAEETETQRTYHKKYRRQQLRFPNLTRELEAHESKNPLKLKITKSNSDPKVPTLYQIIKTPRPTQ